MPFQLALFLVVAGWWEGTHGGVPECSTVIQSECELRVNTAFGNAVSMRFDGKWGEVKNNPTLNDALCDADHWKARSEMCGPCPLNLEVVFPSHLAGKICLTDNVHLPYAPDMHMHLAHPLNGKEVELRTFRDNGGYVDFCDEANWGTAPQNGSIAITSSGLGACGYNNEAPLVNAKKAGHSMVIEINNFFYSSALTRPYGADNGFYSMNRPVQSLQHDAARRSEGVEDLLVFHAAPHSDIKRVMKALHRNETVKGKIVFSCDKFDAYSRGELDTSQYYTDGCPWWKLTELDMCDHSADDVNRLCSRCPVEMHSSTGKVGCLYGPDLLPSRKRLFFDGVFGMPFTETVVFIDSYLFRSRVCMEATWPQEFRGRIIALQLPDPLEISCDWVDVIKRAQEAGVKGLILLNMKVPGLSYGVEIPVGSVVKDLEPVEEFMRSGKKWDVAGHTVHEVEVRFTKGTLEPHPVAPQRDDDKESASVPTEDSNVLSEPRALAGVVVLPCLAVLIAIKAYRSSQAKVALPKAPGVPLSLLSTGLSLTLLLLVSIITFTLAYRAGQKAVDTASANGEEAVASTNQRNLANVKSLTALLMNDVINGAANSYLQWKRYLHLKARVAARIMEPSKYTTWTAFHKRTLDFEHVADTDVPGEAMQVLYANGFFYDHAHNINDFESNMSNGSYVGKLQETNKPSLYGFRTTKGIIVPRSRYDPFKRIDSTPLPAGYRTVFDYLDERRRVSLAEEEGIFHVSQFHKHFNPKTSNDGPHYSILEPLKGEGAVVASASCASLSRELEAAISSVRNKLPIAENMTIVLFSQDGLIIASNEDLYEATEVFGFAGDKPLDLGYRLYTVHDTRTVQVNALANLLAEKFGTLDVKHVNDTTSSAVASEKVVLEFDQSEYYKGPPSTLLHLSFDGTVDDTSGNEWDTVGVGCATGCYEAGYNGSAMRFNGSSHVAVLPYLTTRVHWVQATKIPSANGVWTSSRLEYSTTMQYDGVSDVIEGFEAYSGKINPVYRNPFYLNAPYSLSVVINPSRNDTVPETVRPRIVGDSRDGDGSFRWYANGQLKVSVARYGCVTQPLAIPTNQWTHLVATVSFRERYCAVYMNGVEASRGTLAYTTKLLFTKGNITVGDFFEGLMDDFRVHNRSLNADDVRHLIATGNGVAASRKQWSASVDALRSPGNPLLLIAALVPTEDVVRDVEALNKATEERLTKQRENTDTKLERKVGETVIIVACVAMVATLFFLLFNDVLTSPFASFARDLYQTARMDVDNIDTDSRSTCLKEINIMHHAMVRMVLNIREYKSFMPQSLMENIALTSDSDSSIDNEPSVSTSDRTQSHSQADARGASEAALISVTVRKRVSFVVVNLSGWHRACEEATDTQMLGNHSNYLSVCIATCTKYKGVPEPFTGDRMMLTFNGPKHCSCHQMAACYTALDIGAGLEGSATPHLTMSVTSGRCKTGNMGSATMRRYSYVGSVVSWAHALERYCRVTLGGVGIANLCDSEVLEATTGHAMACLVGSVLYEKHSQRALLVAEIAGKREATEGEWMYQLEGMANAGTYSNWNRAVDATLSGNWSAAREALSAVPVDAIRPALRSRIEGALSLESYDPDVLLS